MCGNPYFSSGNDRGKCGITVPKLCIRKISLEASGKCFRGPRISDSRTLSSKECMENEVTSWRSFVQCTVGETSIEFYPITQREQTLSQFKERNAKKGSYTFLILSLLLTQTGRTSTSSYAGDDIELKNSDWKTKRHCTVIPLSSSSFAYIWYCTTLKWARFSSYAVSRVKSWASLSHLWTKISMIHRCPGSQSFMRVGPYLLPVL